MTRIGIVGIAAALLLAPSCRKKAPASFLDEGSSASEVMNGLRAKPGTPARLKAAQEFETRFLAELAKLRSDREANAETRKWQEMTLRAFRFSIDSLKNGPTCAEEEKVTLYRGHGESPWRKQEDGRYGAAAANAFSGYKSPFPSYDYKEIFWNTRFLMAPSGADVELPLELRLDNLMRSHTMDSSSSPLISTTLSAAVAGRFGPQVLALRMCPERIFPVYDVRYYSEYEFYVPLFLLPEEMTGDGPESQWPSGWPSEGHADSLWHCFTNLGTTLEHKYAADEETQVRESEDENRPRMGILRRYRTYRDELYAVLASTGDAAAWREKMTARAAQCKVPDCALARRVEAKEKERLQALGAQATPEDKERYGEFQEALKASCGAP